MDPLALTSRWMAAARAREGESPHRHLFFDPLAAELAGPEGFAWLERTEPATRLGGRAGPLVGPGLYVVVRTRFFDDFLLRACRDGGARQVVLLAAGMDAQAFRLPWPPGTRLYELDRPEVLAAKEEVLARLRARAICERRAIGADSRTLPGPGPYWTLATRRGSRPRGSRRGSSSPSTLSSTPWAGWRRGAAGSGRTWWAGTCWLPR